MVAEDHRALISGPGTLVTVLPIGAREVHGLPKEYSNDSKTVLSRCRTPRGRGVDTRVVQLPLVSGCMDYRRTFWVFACFNCIA